MVEYDMQKVNRKHAVSKSEITNRKSDVTGSAESAYRLIYSLTECVVKTMPINLSVILALSAVPIHTRILWGRGKGFDPSIPHCFDNFNKPLVCHH